MNKKSLNKISIVAFIVWVSFFPEPIQEKYELFVKIILLFLLFFLWIIQKSITITQKEIPLLIFLLFLLGGIFSAKNKLVAIETYSNLALPLFCLYFLGKIIFSQEKNISFLAKTICLLSIFVSLLGILDVFFGKNFLYEYLIDNQYYDRYVREALLKRPLSTQFNPAPLGSYLLFCIPFSLILIKEGKWRLFGFLAMVINSVVLIMTFSRAAFVGFFVSILFYLFNMQKRKMAISLLIGLFIIIFICSFIKFGKGFDRFGVKGMIFGKDYTSPLSDYRIARMKMVFNILKEYPLFGIGLNHIRIRFFEFYPQKEDVGYEWRIADNMYLTILGETGIVGFISFLYFIFSLFRKGLKEKKDCVFITLSTLLGILVNMTGYELFYWHIPYYLFCFLCGIVASQISIKIF